MADVKKSVLIVEDEKSTAHALELKLTKAGFSVTINFNGEEALETLKTGKFDVILMDLMMPKLDGFTVLEELKNRGNKIPIIVTSNLGQEADAERAKTLGAKEYIIKSDTPLVEVIEHIKKVAG